MALTKEEFLKQVEDKVNATYNEHIELLQQQYPTSKHYLAWIAAMLEAEFLFNACNQKDLAGILLAGVQPITEVNVMGYFDAQFDMIAEGEEEINPEQIDLFIDRLKTLLADPSDEHEDF